MKKKKKNKGRRTKLKDKLTPIFAQYIRLKYADENGRVKCVTCGKEGYWKKDDMVAGHYKHSLDFIEENYHVQCQTCNSWHSGRLDVYTLFMIDKYGRNKVDELTLLKNQNFKLTADEIEEAIPKYTKLVKEMESELH